MSEKKRKPDETGANIGDEVNAPKKTKSFDLKLFRKALKTNDFIFEIKGFIRAANDDPSTVSDYLKGKGTILELVDLLKKIDTTNIGHISSIFEAIQLVLLEVVNCGEEYKGVALPGTTNLLNNSKSLIVKCLQSDVESHRLSTLKLLTGCVVLSSTFAVPVLKVFDLLVVEKKVSESIFKTMTITNETLHDNIRKSYIQLMLAFLMETDIQVVTQLLHRDFLIHALMVGLKHDDLADLALILDTIKSKILQRLEITKTQKKRAFSEESVKCIVDAYKWLGPRFLIHHKEQLVDEDSQKEAAQHVHEFLKLLLTSRKYGIAFNALGKENRKNIVQMLVLRQLKYFWNEELSSELVIEIITACPELIRVLMDRIAIGIRPKLNESWFNCILFTQNLLKQINVSTILASIKHLEPKRVTEYILNFSLCQSILQHLNENTMLKGKSLDIKTQLMKLLYIMLKQCNLFLIELQKLEILDYDLRKIKFNVINQIFAYFPSVDTLLNSLLESIKTIRGRKSDETREQLNSTLDIILLLHEMVPSVVKKGGEIINYINVLRPIYDFQSTTESSAADKLSANLKVVKLILVLEPDVFNQNSTLFQPVLEMLIKVYVLSEDEMLQESQFLLQKLLATTGLFDEGLLEINILLISLKQVNAKALPKLIKYLVTVLQQKPSDEKFEIEADLNETDLVSLFKKIESATDAEVKSAPSAPLMILRYPSLVSSAVQSGHVESLKDFFEYMALGLYLVIPEKQSISSLIASSFGPSKLNKYFKSWEKSSNQFPKLQAYELPEKFQQIGKLLDSIIDAKYDLTACPDNLTDLQICFCIQAVIFTVIQLTKRDAFTFERSQVVMDYIRGLMPRLKASEDYKEQVVQLETLDGHESASPTLYLLRYIFCYQYQLLNLFNLKFDRESSKNLSVFIAKLTDEAKSCISYKNDTNYLEHFRRKVVAELNEILSGASIAEDHFQNLIEIVDSFELTADNCLNIVTHISGMKIRKAANKSLLVQLLIISLNRLAKIQSKMAPSVVFAKLVEQICKSDRELLVQIETSLYEYLVEFPQTLPELPLNFVDSLVEVDSSDALSKTSIKLVCLIFERDVRQHENILNFVLKHIEKRELVYPLLNTAFENQILNKDIDKAALNKIYNEFKSGILKIIEKPQKVGAIYKENIISSLCLIHHCMPVNECVDFCNKTIKFSGVELYQLHIMAAIYYKAFKNVEAKTKKAPILVNFINNYVTLFNFLFKNKKQKSTEVEPLLFLLEKFLLLKDDCETEFDFSKLTSSQPWQNFVKNSLTFAMSFENEANAAIMRQLAVLCNIVYSSDDAEDVAYYFNMAISHNLFFDIALDTKGSAIKEGLFHFLCVMAHKSPQVAQEKHLPIFLGAYNATLGNCDRYILALLQLYEAKKMMVSKFQPLVWGEAAIVQHSLKEEKSTDVLSKKSNVEVLNLLDSATLKQTLVEYPIWRKLAAGEQLPDVDLGKREGFYNLKQQHKFVEGVEGKCVGSIDWIRPVTEEKVKEIYDPAWLIPLMSQIFGPDQPDLTLIAAQKSLIAIAFAALSSKDASMRLAAASVIVRCRTQLEGGKQFLGKEVWLRLYDSVQSGLHQLSKQTSESKGGLQIPRPFTFSTLFIGHAVNILPSGSNELFPVLSNYFVIKPIYDFGALPEFFNLFFSHELKFKSYRTFILTLIRDGLKTIDDFLFIFKSQGFVLKPLLACFKSAQSDTELDLVILDVLKQMTALPLAADVLIARVGLITWLVGAINRVETWHFDTICSLIDILSNLWFSVQKSRESYKNPEQIELQLMALNLVMLPKLTVKLATKSVEVFYEVLLHSCTGRFELVSQESYQTLVKFSEIVLNEAQFKEITKIELQGDSAQSTEQFVKKLTETESGECHELNSMEKIMVYAREFCLQWSLTSRKVEE